MSQALVFLLLKELGGRAKSGEIRKLAKEKYPDRSLHHYVSQKLWALKRNGYIDLDGNRNWIILEKPDFVKE